MPIPIVLDLDGVVVESNLLKHRAMLAMFEGHQHQCAAIDSYILANYGVRRDHKFRHILTNILHLGSVDDILDDYLARYEVALDRLLATAPLVPGIDAFLAQGAHPFYVSSSAPDLEVYEQLSRRGLAGYFSAIFGANTPKVEALRQVTQKYPGLVPVFFGDSVGDWEAAKEARVAFVAVTSERDNFPDQPVVKLGNFSSCRAVQESINKALIERAT